MAKYKAKGKDLLNHDMQAIFKDLYNIDAMIKNGNDSGPRLLS